MRHTCQGFYCKSDSKRTANGIEKIERREVGQRGLTDWPTRLVRGQTRNHRNSIDQCPVGVQVGRKGKYITRRALDTNHITFL